MRAVFIAVLVAVALLLGGNLVHVSTPAECVRPGVQRSASRVRAGNNSSPAS